MGFSIAEMLSGNIVQPRQAPQDNSSAGLGQMLSFLMNSNQQPVAKVDAPQMPSLSELAAISAGRRKEKQQADATEQLRQLVGTPEIGYRESADPLSSHNMITQKGSGLLGNEYGLDRVYKSLMTSVDPQIQQQAMVSLSAMTPKPTTADPYFTLEDGGENGQINYNHRTGSGDPLIINGKKVYKTPADVGLQSKLSYIKVQNNPITVRGDDGTEQTLPLWEYLGMPNPNVNLLQQQSTAAPQANGSSVAQDNVINNNPHNIKQPGTNNFQKFATPEEGRKSFNNIMKSYSGRGLNTIEKIIRTYSPDNENDTAGLISNAEKFTGIPKDQVLNMDDPQVLDMLSNMTLKNEGNLPTTSTAPISRVTNAQSTEREAIQKATGTKTGEYHAGEVLSLPSKIERANLLRDLLVKAVNHPGLEGVVAVRNLSELSGFPGTEQQNFKILMDQIKGINFLDAYSQLKGGGPITDIEGAAATAAKARLKFAQSEPEFKLALNEMITTIDRETKAQEVRVNGANSPNNAFKERGQLKIKSNSPVEAKPKLVNGKPIIKDHNEYLKSMGVN